jgi:AcrR family transcriptional regulator
MKYLFNPAGTLHERACACKQACFEQLFSYRRSMARTTGSHSDVTDRRLRTAATALFARHGYAAVSMRQIAAEVGVQVGALYNYIPDKQTLLFDLMRDHLENLLEAYRDQPALDTKMRLRHFVEFHIRFHHDRPDAVFIAYMELRNLTPENFALIEALRDRYEACLRDIIEAGVASCDFQVSDSRVATRAVIAMLTGITTWFRPGGGSSLSEIEMHYQQLVRGALGAGEGLG